MTTCNQEPINRHKRSRLFSTSCPLLPKVEMILFAKDMALRKHTIKHFFNEAEWSSWKLFASGRGNNIGAMRDRKRRLQTELQCRYYSEKHSRGDAPCGDLCSEFKSRCEEYMADWDSRYAATVENIIVKSLEQPLWIYWVGKDRLGVMHHFIDFLCPSDFGIHIVSIMFHKTWNSELNGQQFVVLTAHKTNYRLNEILNSIRDRADHIIITNVPSKPENEDWQRVLCSWGK